MKVMGLKGKIGGYILAFSVLFGVGAASSVTTKAQYRNDQDGQYRRDRDRDRGRNDNDENRRGRNWDRYGSYGGSYELRQTALNAGYNEGIKEGRKDRNRRERNLNSISAYQKATKDYSSKLGNKELYRRYYREGFENGYADGIRGY